MVGDVPWVTVLIVLVEGPVGPANEPGYAGATQGVLPPSDVPLVLGQGELPGGDDAVGRHDAHAGNGRRLGFFLQKFPRDLGHQVPGCRRTFWAGWGLATCSPFAGFKLLGQGLAWLLVFVLFAQPIDEFDALFPQGHAAGPDSVVILLYNVGEAGRVERGARAIHRLARLPLDYRPVARFHRRLDRPRSDSHRHLGFGPRSLRLLHADNLSPPLQRVQVDAQTRRAP